MNPHRIAAATVAFALAACTANVSEGPPSPAPPSAMSPSAPSATPIATPDGFVLVGREPLFARGMNAGLAVRPPYAYIGNRSDGSNEHPHAGVLIVDVSDPTAPRVAGEIPAPPDGTSTRELRIWRDEDVLIVLELRCGAATHACSGVGRHGLRFFDIRGERARTPFSLLTYTTDFDPHEMYLWVDRSQARRALLYVSTDTPGDGEAGLVVFDVSDVRAGRIRELARWTGNRALGGRLHSLGLSADGHRAYLAHLAGGFAVLDTTALARGAGRPELRLATALGNVLRWSPGPHSAVAIGGRGLVLTTDEVYGGDRACPWGWARLIDTSDPSAPRLEGELRTPFNAIGACADVPRSAAYSYSSHAPTVVGDLAFITWHGAGVVAARLAGGRLTGTAAFVPQPLARVITEDPRLTAGPVKVAMWSTPIVADGLIYVVDVRNGLNVLRYTGVGSDAVARTRHAEGNSNVS